MHIVARSYDPLQPCRRYPQVLPILDDQYEILRTMEHAEDREGCQPTGLIPLIKSALVTIGLILIRSQSARRAVTWLMRVFRLSQV
jgi:hypothetical protein